MAGHDKITAGGKEFFKQIEELKKLQVRVGYQKGAVVNDDVDLLDIAAFNELGTSRAPSRPFMRQSVDANKETIEKFCKAQLNKIIKGATVKQILNAIGVMQKGLIQDTVTRSKEWAAPNADYTVKKKGSDVPLIDTARMLQSPQYVVVKKGGGD